MSYRNLYTENVLNGDISQRIWNTLKEACFASLKALILSLKKKVCCTNFPCILFQWSSACIHSDIRHPPSYDKFLHSDRDLVRRESPLLCCSWDLRILKYRNQQHLTCAFFCHSGKYLYRSLRWLNKWQKLGNKTGLAFVTHTSVIGFSTSPVSTQVCGSFCCTNGRYVDRAIDTFNASWTHTVVSTIF